MKYLPYIILSLLIFAIWSCSSDSGTPTGNSCPQEVDCAGVCAGPSIEDVCGVCDGDESSCNISYSATIYPIFEANCIVCHGHGGSGGLYLVSYSELMGNDVIIPGNSSESKLISKLKGTAGLQMPKDQNPLDDTTIDLIATWIDEGALEN